MADSTRTHELMLWGALAIWATLLLTGVLVGLRMGFGGWPFAAAMAVCGVLLAGLLLPAAPRVSEQIVARCRGGGAWTVLVPLGAATYGAAAWVLDIARIRERLGHSVPILARSAR